MILKKEVTSSSGNGEGGRGGDEADVSSYRQALVRTLHACSVKFATVAPSVVPLVNPPSLSLFLSFFLYMYMYSVQSISYSLCTCTLSY